MTDQDQIKIQLENIFDKYKFTKEQRSKAALELIEVGEIMVFDKLSVEMNSEQKISFEKLLISTEKSEDKIKNIYAFIDKACTKEKLNNTRKAVFEELLSDYIKNMNI